MTIVFSDHRALRARRAAGDSSRRGWPTRSSSTPSSTSSARQRVQENTILRAGAIQDPAGLAKIELESIKKHFQGGKLEADISSPPVLVKQGHRRRGGGETRIEDPRATRACGRAAGPRSHAWTMSTLRSTGYVAHGVFKIVLPACPCCEGSTSTVAAGQVAPACFGHNGAGKSTLMKILAGAEAAGCGGASSSTASRWCSTARPTALHPRCGLRLPGNCACCPT